MSNDSLTHFFYTKEKGGQELRILEIPQTRTFLGVEKQNKIVQLSSN